MPSIDNLLVFSLLRANEERHEKRVCLTCTTGRFFFAYTATKHGVTGITKSTSLDGREFQIACGQIDIGNAETELAKRPLTGALQASGQTTPEPMMDVDHAASAVAYMASLPLDTNVLFMTVMANHMPFVGRG